MKDRNSKLERRITCGDIDRIREGISEIKKETGYDIDKETGAIIVYAISAVYQDGEYYSLEDGRRILDGNCYSLEDGHRILKGNYVKEIRQKVGKVPLQVPGTGVVVYRTNPNGDIEVYLQKRSDCSKYGLPGGGIELGETYEQSAVNELEQETGLIAEEDDLILFHVYAGPLHVTKYPNGDVVFHTVVVYFVPYEKCRKADHDVDDETLEMRWFNSEEVSNLLESEDIFPNNVPILMDIIDVFGDMKNTD